MCARDTRNSFYLAGLQIFNDASSSLPITEITFYSLFTSGSRTDFALTKGFYYFFFKLDFSRSIHVYDFVKREN